MRLRVIFSTANIIADPQDLDRITDQDSQLLYGEEFIVEEPHGAYVYGHSVLDGYKGYVARDQLVKAEDMPEPTHWVCAPATHLYPQPDFKSRPDMSISYLSRVALTDKEENGFVQIHDGQWIFKDHLGSLSDMKMKGDLASTASLFLGTPYLYGGRSSFGIDCSGLIQLALIGHGQPCPPRDSKDQQGSFGTEIKNMAELQRNDVVYFKGHVGIMVDKKNILNATARHMTTLIEPLKELEKSYGGITTAMRP
ncbi:MAG: NlpC/P60 family protein [Alphaproteobacteria bacterium]|nr:NlpC/P60 family protein [Alphaproteobacteria bacterium]